MPRKTKRKQQVSKILRKKGCFVSQNQVIIEETIIEEAVENEKWMENEIIEEYLEDETIDWTGEELKEFDKVGDRLITEVLLWHEGADHSIRAVYTGLQCGGRKKKKKN
jgi:hypothetical protein